jgi:hypothetical protein
LFSFWLATPSVWEMSGVSPTYVIKTEEVSTKFLDSDGGKNS